MSLNLTESAKAKNAIILVCGCPRSGTTHIAQKIFDCIRAKDNNIQYYIELNITEERLSSVTGKLGGFYTRDIYYLYGNITYSYVQYLHNYMYSCI